MAGLDIGRLPAGGGGGAAAGPTADAAAAAVAAAAAAAAAAGPGPDAPNKPPQLFPVRVFERDRAEWSE
jgi:3-oxoacyl-ACP reductase-like protein